jgi:hypothetical protein
MTGWSPCRALSRRGPSVYSCTIIPTTEMSGGFTDEATASNTAPRAWVSSPNSSGHRLGKTPSRTFSDADGLGSCGSRGSTPTTQRIPTVGLGGTCRLPRR